MPLLRAFIYRSPERARQPAWPRPPSRSPRARSGALLGLALGLFGCVDPGGKYDDFVARKEAGKDMSGDGSSADGDMGPVELPEPEQITGSYLYVVALSGVAPTFYLLEVEAQREGEQLSLSMRYRALAYADRETPVEDFNEWETYEVDPAGYYETPELMITVPGAANTFGVDAVVSKLVFRGNVGNGKLENDDPDGKVVFFCGDVGPDVEAVVFGVTQKPGGGTFTASRILDENDYPDAVLNCEGDLVKERRP
jgi:hypothetical protein